MPPDGVDELDGMLLRLEELLAAGTRVTPPPERDRMADLIHRYAPDRRRGPPRTLAACHELVLDMQEPELLKRITKASRTRYT